MKYVKMLIAWWLQGWKNIFHHMFGEHEWTYRPDLVYRDDNGREHMVLECVHCHRLSSIDGMISRMDASISQSMAARLRVRHRTGALMIRTDHSVVRI